MALMFPPAQKAVPAPVKTAARTVLSFWMSRQAASTAAYSCPEESAFLVSGEFNVAIAMRSRFSSFTKSFMASLAALVEPQQRACVPFEDPVFLVVADRERVDGVDRARDQPFAPIESKGASLANSA